MEHEVDQQEEAVSGTLDLKSGGSGTHCRIFCFSNCRIFVFPLPNFKLR